MNIDRWLLYQWIRNVENRKIIIFGSDIRAEKLYHKLELMDLRVGYFVDNVLEEHVLCGCEVRNYNELLYEDPERISLIILEEANLDRLIDIGVCTKWSIHNYLMLFSYNPLRGLYPMDPTVGYNIWGDTEYPGFVLFGDKDAECTIVTLGGSTTDAIYALCSTNKKIRSWSEILASKLKEEKISARILCGGVAGYKSSQELLKLIRDVIPLQPDMVITYDGYNDVHYVWEYPWEKDYSFFHHYQIELFSAISKVEKKGILADEYTLGINTKWDSYVGWKNAVKMMHLICEDYGIKHVSVLQPSFYNQIGKFGKMKDVELWMHSSMSDEHKQLFDTFFNKRDEDAWQPEWLKDLRTIFQRIDGIFYDQSHVEEAGNEIIADRMCSYVKEILLK